MKNIVRSILQIVNAIETPEGAGAMVRRSIGVANARSYDPFLMFDHFSSSGTLGFPEHPHKGQETVTLMLKGRMAHEDFTGSKGILYPGDLQFMTAGKGIVHSEMPVPNEDGSPTVGLQLWVDLPHNLKNCEPRYRDLRAWEIPTATSDDGDVTVKVISGKYQDVESVQELAYTPLQYYYVNLQNNGVYKQDVDENFNYFLYILNGTVKINGKEINQYQNVFFDRDGDQIVVENNGTPSEMVLIGGEVLKQRSIQYGPFVGKSESDIMMAFNNYEYAQNGFESRRTWKTLISNGVTQEMIDGPLDGSLEKRNQLKAEFDREIHN